MGDDTITWGPAPTRHGSRYAGLPTRWKLEKLLGVGGQAEVWLAFDNHLGELVALKIFKPELSPEALTRLRREVKLGRQLHHPHLVRVFELVEMGDRLGFAMEWLPGGSLKQRLCGGPLPVAEVERIAGEILSALQFLHEKGIVHRDVKPSNVLLDAHECVRLADLGLARNLEGELELTYTAAHPGTPVYMSPEQRRGEKVTPAADLYSLGVTLFELLTGTLPFAAQSEVDLALMQLKNSPPNPRKTRPDCPRWLARFVMRLLERAPRDRFAHAGAALQAFSKRRAVHSPRALRRAALHATVATVVVVAGFWGWQEARWLPAGRRPVTVSWADREVVARDGEGHVLWHYQLQAPVTQVELWDLDGDGFKEVLVATKPPENQNRRDLQSPPGEIVILSRDGILKTRFSPDLNSGAPEPHAPGTFVPSFLCADLNADGKPEVLVNSHHRTLGLSFLHVFWPDVGYWRPILHHVGWVISLWPIPDPHRPRLRFLANNGPLLETQVVAEVEISPPGTPPPLAVNALVGVPFAWVSFSWYTPVGQFWNGSDFGRRFLWRPDGSGFLTGGGQGVGVDRWGNPSAGPNAGKNLSALRVQLLARLNSSPAFVFSEDAAAVRAYFSRLRQEHETLLQEIPYRAILAFFEAQALAQTGDRGGAGVLLQESWRETQYEALGLLLAHLQALEGDLDAAAATLRQVISSNFTPMAGFYAPRLLTRVAIQKRDRHLLGLVLTRLSGPLTPASGLSRARVWWDEALDEDCQPAAYDTEPEAEALSFVARWRLGRVREEDLGRVEAALARNSDAWLAGKVARAVVLLALNRAEEARVELEIEQTRWEAKARDNFELAQTLELARAVYAKALLASGRRAEALRLARALKPSLRPGLLPAILVEEVLAAGAQKPRPSSRQGLQ